MADPKPSRGALDSDSRSKIVPTAELRRSLEYRIDIYQSQFFDSDIGRSYWMDRRLSERLAEELRIGYVSDAIAGDQWFAGCLAIPYLSSAGPVSIKFRALDGQGQKYRYDKGQIHRIYNTLALQEAESIVITEGEIDAASFVQSGIPAVALPGATSFKAAWRRIFFNRKVTVFCDGDDAGRKMGDALSSALWGARIIEAPEGEDANSILVQHGPDRLRELVK